MKTTKLPLVCSLALALLALPVFARGPGGNGRGNPDAPRNGSGQCDPSQCPNPDGPVCDGSGAGTRGNPQGNGTPRRDGSGKATAPGKGAKDGTGNRADCPNA